MVTNLNFIIFIYLIKVKYMIFWTCINFKIENDILKNNINYILKFYLII
jgi:hypothetical protein